MRIVVMGQAAFGAKFVQEIAAREEIIGVYGPPEVPGGKPDPIKVAATEKGLPYYQPGGYKQADVLAEFQALKPDLLIMAFVTPILPAAFLNAPTQGSICYHPSLLPRHRGASAINWAVMMGDDKTGLTIFWADGGIDTGPILLQKEIPIGWEDTTGSLYFNHLFPLGIEALLESVALIKHGTAPRLPQDERLATYEPVCNDDVAGVDWTKPGKEIYNLIRGCDPQPGAHAILQGKKVHFYGTKFKPAKQSSHPGALLHCDENGLAIAVHGGFLEIAKVRPEGAPKVAAQEFFRTAELNVGQRFS
jgi:methionyl-tRNA formyltransferase